MSCRNGRNVHKIIGNFIGFSSDFSYSLVTSNFSICSIFHICRFRLSADAVSKPVCVSNGLMPPKISLIWNAVDDYQSSFQFAYNVLYCYKPHRNNKFCFHPPFGYNTSKDCTGLSLNSSSRNGSMVLECNVTSLFRRLVPVLFDIHAPVTTPKIIFSVNIGNIQSDGYSTFKVCDPTKLGIKLIS